MTIDTTRPEVERTLRLAVTNRHITPATERLALALLERAETAESQREALILMAEGADAERDALQAEVARLRGLCLNWVDLAERTNREYPHAFDANRCVDFLQGIAETRAALEATP
jgi:hypothetical protein